MDRLFNNLLDSSSSSSSDDDFPRQRRVRVVKQRNDLFNELDEMEFKKRFRMDKNTFQEIETLLPDIEEPLDNRNHPISKRNQILIFLRFCATASFQINLGDHFNVSQPTVSRIVVKVASNVASLRPQFITMPQTEDNRRETVLKFFNIAGLPGIIDAVDCSHIKIQSPGGDNAEVFRNRKQWFSINTQVVADSDLKICDIVARWPGSVHDTTIFNDSNIRARFEHQEFSPYFIVGDSGYPCRQYLLTPILDPQTPSENRYNNAQIASRNPVERLFGVWKRRFPCLSLGMRLKLETTCLIIVARAVLHNICVLHNDTLEHLDAIAENLDEIIGVVEPNPMNHQNFATRDAIIATVFT